VTDSVPLIPVNAPTLDDEGPGILGGKISPGGLMLMTRGVIPKLLFINGTPQHHQVIVQAVTKDVEVGRRRQ
jgi:hypothetical protein